MRSITVQLETASNNSSNIVKYAIKALDIIFKEGFNYLKCGVIVMDLVPEHQVQGSLFARDDGKGKIVMAAMDKVNRAMGKETVRLAVQGFEKRYRLKAEYLSPCYTTNLAHILKVKI